MLKAPSLIHSYQQYLNPFISWLPCGSHVWFRVFFKGWSDVVAALGRENGFGGTFLHVNTDVFIKLCSYCEFYKEESSPGSIGLIEDIYTIFITVQIYTRINQQYLLRTNVQCTNIFIFRLNDSLNLNIVLPTATPTFYFPPTPTSYPSRVSSFPSHLLLALFLP